MTDKLYPATPVLRSRSSDHLVGEVGLEPTKAAPADLQSAPFAARDIPPSEDGVLNPAIRPLSLGVHGKNRLTNNHDSRQAHSLRTKIAEGAYSSISFRCQ